MRPYGVEILLEGGYRIMGPQSTDHLDLKIETRAAADLLSDFLNTAFEQGVRHNQREFKKVLGV